jgi:AcrR family transcriptional regulator
MSQARRPNRGPSAAAENRAALIAAAREVFAAAGIDAPLSTVARVAGVGQGSLYRHFPDRVSLALAVFEDSMAGLEGLAAEPGTTLDDLLTLITEQAITSTAFVDMMVLAQVDDARIRMLQRRLADLLADGLMKARLAGEVRDDVTVEDMRMTVSMAIAVLPRMAPDEARRETAERAWKLLRRGFGS